MHSFRFLPPERRLAITALYAYCREIDDVVDSGEEKQIAQVQLDEWRDEVSNMLKGHPSHPVTIALSPHLATYNIQGEHLFALIDGMQMDLDQRNYPDFEALSSYCWHVASVVGIMAASIFGATTEKTIHYAEKLGLAFQLTNIIRDVGEDIQLGRIYLPEDERIHFGVKKEDLLNLEYSQNFADLMAFMAKRAHETYDEAMALLPRQDRKAQKPGLIMANIYRSLLVKIEKENFRTLDRRISLSTPRKLWLAWRAYAGI